MKLPHYKAVSFNDIIRLGGHSKPWIISTEGETYVVKLYKTIDLEARNKMAAEVIGNLLAKEFDLQVPDAAIIEFDDSFRMSLKEEEEEILSLLDERCKFGSVYLTESYLYSVQIDYSNIEENIAPDTLYAFDYLICNRDRTLLKPNLLVTNNKIVLIDHEMALEINDQTLSNLQQSIWDKRYTHHLFYDRLKNSSEETKEHYFEEFAFYLQEIRWNKFNEIFAQLQDLGFDPQAKKVKEYFKCVQQNTNKFINILKDSIK